MGVRGLQQTAKLVLSGCGRSFAGPPASHVALHLPSRFPLFHRSSAPVRRPARTSAVVRRARASHGADRSVGGWVTTARAHRSLPGRRPARATSECRPLAFCPSSAAASLPSAFIVCFCRQIKAARGASPHTQPAPPPPSAVWHPSVQQGRQSTAVLFAQPSGSLLLPGLPRMPAPRRVSASLNPATSHFLLPGGHTPSCWHSCAPPTRGGGGGSDQALYVQGLPGWGATARVQGLPLRGHGSTSRVSQISRPVCTSRVSHCAGTTARPGSPRTSGGDASRVSRGAGGGRTSRVPRQRAMWGGHDLLCTKQSPRRTHAGVQGALNIVRGLPTGSQGLSQAVQGLQRVVQGLSPYTRWRPGSPNTCPGSAAARPGCAYHGPGSAGLGPAPPLLSRPGSLRDMPCCGGPPPSSAPAVGTGRPWTAVAHPPQPMSGAPGTGATGTETLDECVHRPAPPLTPPPGHQAGACPDFSPAARAAGKVFGSGDPGRTGRRNHLGPARVSLAPCTPLDPRSSP